MGAYGNRFTRRLNFDGAGTQTIAPTSGSFALVRNLTFFLSAANVTITVSIGGTVIANGLINVSPVQLTFGEGLGSHVSNEPITVVSSGASDVFVHYIEQKANA